MPLFNQVLALPVSQEPRTVSSSQLCRNTALKTRKPQRSLEQQTSSACWFSRYLQLLPQLHSSERGRTYSCQEELFEEQYWWAEQHQHHLPQENGFNALMGICSLYAIVGQHSRQKVLKWRQQ